jgi:carnitine O-acetyltransferase
MKSDREYSETEHVVHDFLEREGPGLQEKLIKYAENKDSYIEQFWYDSYLNFDNRMTLTPKSY